MAVSFELLDLGPVTADAEVDGMADHARPGVAPRRGGVAAVLEIAHEVRIGFPAMAAITEIPLMTNRTAGPAVGGHLPVHVLCPAHCVARRPCGAVAGIA